ncbi:hypothetical protein BJ508DRAFT_10316 [Ascobolus immersus RN42]|uniref:Uncharacterized protein n=1 Tax=Ascobolus immersus RN42 TaxID=1160509 RepID=A0A3N4HWK7_ASCIM|nr:hypothetical protein BJ508DRAFT_10316 [Ascobolus immersus RN42]
MRLIRALVLVLSPTSLNNVKRIRNPLLTDNDARRPKQHNPQPSRPLPSARKPPTSPSPPSKKRFQLAPFAAAVCTCSNRPALAARAPRIQLIYPPRSVFRRHHNFKDCASVHPTGFRKSFRPSLYRKGGLIGQHWSAVTTPLKAWLDRHKAQTLHLLPPLFPLPQD